MKNTATVFLGFKFGLQQSLRMLKAEIKKRNRNTLIQYFLFFRVVNSILLFTSSLTLLDYRTPFPAVLATVLGKIFPQTLLVRRLLTFVKCVLAQ